MQKTGTFVFEGVEAVSAVAIQNLRTSSEHCVVKLVHEVVKVVMVDRWLHRSSEVLVFKLVLQVHLNGYILALRADKLG